MYSFERSQSRQDIGRGTTSRLSGSSRNIDFTRSQYDRTYTPTPAPQPRRLEVPEFVARSAAELPVAGSSSRRRSHSVSQAGTVRVDVHTHGTGGSKQSRSSDKPPERPASAAPTHSHSSLPSGVIPSDTRSTNPGLLRSVLQRRLTSSKRPETASQQEDALHVIPSDTRSHIPDLRRSQTPSVLQGPTSPMRSRTLSHVPSQPPSTVPGDTRPTPHHNIQTPSIPSVSRHSRTASNVPSRPQSAMQYSQRSSIGDAGPSRAKIPSVASGSSWNSVRTASRSTIHETGLLQEQKEKLQKEKEEILQDLKTNRSKEEQKLAEITNQIKIERNNQDGTRDRLMRIRHMKSLIEDFYIKIYQTRSALSRIKNRRDLGGTPEDLRQKKKYSKNCLKDFQKSFAI